MLKLLVVLGRLPLPLLRGLGWVLGGLLYLLVGSRRRVVMTNLALCFPQWSPSTRRRQCFMTFVYFAQAWLDRGWLWHAPQARVRARLQLRGAVDALAGDTPTVVFAPHFMGLDAAWTALTQQIGRRFCTIYSPQLNADVDAWIFAGRQRFGAPEMVARLDGAKPLVAAVRGGEPLYLLPDMNFDPTESLFVPFYGVPAATVPSLSRFARLGRAQVVPVVTRITPQGYVVEVLPPWQDFPTADLEADTARMNRELESYINTMPAQYYWVHKRFKDRPDAAAAPY
ncbi:lipid A biosynthesis acyltransferase [uncultured Rhodoferax sp.]|uniref:LpxL/LpxP family acyltransferase n=1 Tax=uncultured Rhodoferax sp. TaxID=223188 RepID=UPI0025EA5F8D|nr:lipid A biosynthesis acyltransferase [uncultured Rhodoferax sp.]